MVDGSGGRRLRLILNGKRAGDELIREAVYRVRAQGAHLEVRVTWESGDSERLVQEALCEGVDTLIAGGGDGSLNAVISGLLASGREILPSVGLLPAGTANDFASACGIPTDDPYAALRIVLECPPHRIDAVRGGEHYFINVATGGFGAKITAETAPELKSMLGGVAYLLTGLGQLGSIEPFAAHFVGDDEQWEGRYYALAVGNGRLAGGGLPMCPGALLDDGLLDVSLLPAMPFVEAMGVLGDLVANGMAGVDAHLLKKQVQRLRVVSLKPLHFNLDGEPVQARQMEFAVLPRRVAFHLPVGAVGISRT